MFWTIFLITLFALALLSLAWLLWRKWHHLKIIDPATAPVAHTQSLKYKIFQERVERASDKQLKRVQESVVKPIGQGMQNFVRRVAGKLTAVERQYQERQQQEGNHEFDKEMLKLMLEEARKFSEEESWDQAEKKLIEVISHDAKNVEAYEQLGRLYLHKKDYDLALQTFEFLHKLSPEDPSVIASIGEVQTKLGQKEQAYKNFQQAAELSPKNPKYLDFLISAALELGDRHEAQIALDRLREVNPENQKITTFTDRLAELKPTVPKAKKKVTKK